MRLQLTELLRAVLRRAVPLIDDEVHDLPLVDVEAAIGEKLLDVADCDLGPAARVNGLRGVVDGEDSGRVPDAQAVRPVKLKPEPDTDDVPVRERDRTRPRALDRGDALFEVGETPLGRRLLDEMRH